MNAFTFNLSSYYEKCGIYPTRLMRIRSGTWRGFAVKFKVLFLQLKCRYFIKVIRFKTYRSTMRSGLFFVKIHCCLIRNHNPQSLCGFRSKRVQSMRIKAEPVPRHHSEQFHCSYVNFNKLSINTYIKASFNFLSLKYHPLR
jgi:hypothetical protein